MSVLDVARHMLTQAGVTATPSSFVLTPLTGGRTGASVTRVATDAGSYVLKVLAARTWRDGALERIFAGEGPLWLASVTRDLPDPLACPMLAAERGPDGAWWMLMRDVSPGIRPWGSFSDEDERTFLAAIARLHARWWDRPELAGLELLTMAETIRMWSVPLAAFLCREQAAAPPWVRAFLADFTPLATLAPKFVELAGQDDAAFYVDLVRDTGWQRGLDEGPQTLVHGDLRRANISFESQGRVTLIDWEFAGRGPGVVDLGHHWFLHFWAYPNGGREPHDRPDLQEFYVEALQTELGHAIDRRQFARQWDLAWLKAFVGLGFCLADAACGDDVPPEKVEMARERCRRALARARQIMG